ADRTANLPGRTPADVDDGLRIRSPLATPSGLAGRAAPPPDGNDKPAGPDMTSSGTRPPGAGTGPGARAGYLRCSISGRAVRSSFARSVTLSVGDAITPNVSLSAHTHSATPPGTRGRQAALPPSEPGSTRCAPADWPMKVSMNPPAEVPV